MKTLLKTIAAAMVLLFVLGIGMAIGSEPSRQAGQVKAHAQSAQAPPAQTSSEPPKSERRQMAEDLLSASRESLRVAANPTRLQDRMRATEALTFLQTFETSPRRMGQEICKMQGNLIGANKYKFECEMGHGWYGVTYKGNVAKSVVLITDGTQCPTFQELGAKATFVDAERAITMREMVAKEQPKLADSVKFETLCLVEGGTG